MPNLIVSDVNENLLDLLEAVASRRGLDLLDADHHAILAVSEPTG